MTAETLSQAEKPIRIGIAGVGYHTRGLFIPCLMVMDGVELTALASSRQETASAAQAKYRVPCYVGYEKLVADENVDAILVSTSSQLLETVACAALENGKHVFVETMGIMTPAGGKRLRELEQKTGKVIQFGYCREYAPIYVKMKSILEEWRQREPGSRLWHAKYYFGYHHTIHILAYMNGPVKSIQGIGGDRGEAYLLEFENGDIASMAVTHTATIVAPMELLEVSSPSALMSAYNYWELRFMGNLTDVYGYEARFDSVSQTVWHPSFTAPYYELSSQYLHGTQPELEGFVHNIRYGGRPVNNVDTAEHAMYVKAASREALRTGERILIQDYIASVNAGEQNFIGLVSQY